jgi:translocation and assembly module TamB
MSDPAPPAGTGVAPPPPRRRRWSRTSLFVAALVATLALAGYVFLTGDAGVGFAVRELALRSGGHLTLEGASGSLLDAVRVRRIVWRGSAAQATATDVTLTWSPTALWSRGVVVQTLGAQHLELDLEASDTAVPLPTSLALPFEIAIEHLAVSRLDWRVGPNRGAIRGLALRYLGGAAGSRVTDVTLGTDRWALTGGAAIGAKPPFPIDGRLALTGGAELKRAETTLALSGTLAAVNVDGSGNAGGAAFTARATLAPLAVVPLVAIAVDAAEIDLAAWDKTLPATRLDVVARAEPVSGGGLAGSVEASNALAGPLDAGKLPLRALSTRFSWRADALALDDLAAEFPGGGHASGRARIPLGTGSAGTWSLALANVDLKPIYAPLVSTRLSGTISADLDRNHQKISGDITDRGIAGGIALRFAATVAGETVDVPHFRLTAAGSELAGRGHVGLAGEHAFVLDAKAGRFDPARFGDFPAGALDAHVAATGVLTPAWRADVNLALAPSSRLAGVALSGTAVGTVARDALRNVNIDLEAGSARLRASGSGSLGAADDVVVATLDVPHLAELVPLLPAAVPRTLTGGLNARAQWRGPMHGGAIDVEAHGAALKLALQLGRTLTIGTLDVKFALAAGAPQPGGGDLAARSIQFDARAANVAGPQGTFDTARARLDGTLARHALSVAFASDDMAIDAAAHGGLDRGPQSGADSGWSWSGSLDALEGRGPLALRLVAPATVAYTRGRVHVGETRLAIADGTLQVSEFTWDDGKVATRGSFTAVPLATAARIAGVPLPMASTVTLGGAWSLAAAPRLNGTATIRREGGDLHLRSESVVNPASVAIGVTSLELAARFTDDAIAATASFASARGGSANARLAIGAVAGAPAGRIVADAPLAFDATAELPTLALLQPWIGTTAVVDGHGSAQITGRGTVGRMALAGTLRADAMRVDAPQYGVHFTDGRLAAHLSEGNVVLDEMVLTAGAGQFRASGTVTAAMAADAATAARIGWRASNFRLFNRPDLHLVVDGDGTIAVAKGKLALAGTLKAVEGRIVYVSDPEATLGADVVVKGWPRRPTSALRASDLPLVVDLALDFGDRLTFVSEGLDTGLSGTVRVTTGPRGLIGKGSITAVNGTYRAFGQKLVIDPGRLVFDGPLDNPGLDFVALRKNLAVEAGVAVTGTVKVPIIQLTSNPPVPDSEKLSWLVLGQGLDRTSGTDFAALQAASALLLGRNSKSVTATIAENFGLDDIAVKSTTARGARNGTADAESRVVAVGKRLSDKLSLVYEQGLTVANSALKIEYSLTRNVTLRAETGVVSGVGIQYNRSFE